MILRQVESIKHAVVVFHSALKPALLWQSDSHCGGAPTAVCEWKGLSEDTVFLLICYESIPGYLITILTKSWGQKRVKNGIKSPASR